MTKLLEKAVSAANRLPPQQQNQVATFLLEEVTRTQLLTKLARAESDRRAGRVVSHAQAKQRLKRWLK